LLTARFEKIRYADVKVTSDKEIDAKKNLK